MRNPWLKRNPALSMFLSATNAWFGAARGQAGNAIKRQQTAAVKGAMLPKKNRRQRSS